MRHTPQAAPAAERAVREAARKAFLFPQAHTHTGVPRGCARPRTTAVQASASATTKAQQTALLDELIRAWAATNEFVALKPLDDPLRRHGIATLQGLGWKFEETLAAIVGEVKRTPEISALLNAENVLWIGVGAVARTCRHRMQRLPHLGHELPHPRLNQRPKHPTPYGYPKKASLTMRAFACGGICQAMAAKTRN